MGNLAYYELLRENLEQVKPTKMGFRVIKNVKQYQCKNKSFHVHKLKHYAKVFY